MKLPKILYTKQQLEERILEMAVEINAFYREEPLLVLGVLKGAFIFTADLVRKLSSHYEVDFLHGDYLKSDAKQLAQTEWMNEWNISNYNILLVPEIIDTGKTCKNLVELLSRFNPKSIKVCTLLDKPSHREVDVKPNWKGFTIDDHYVVGYGLDFKKNYRNLPYIGILDQTH